MTKLEMIEMMIDNEYPKAVNILIDRPRRKFTREERIFQLQYHVLKADILVMFKSYLYWKIEGQC